MDCPVDTILLYFPLARNRAQIVAVFVDDLVEGEDVVEGHGCLVLTVKGFYTGGVMDAESG